MSEILFGREEEKIQQRRWETTGVMGKGWGKMCCNNELLLESGKRQDWKG